VSPYYTTAHALIACAGYINDRLVGKAADWILYSQNTDGSWGYYLPTAEETAYALQSLITWRRQGGNIPLEPIELAARWLRDHAAPPYPMLWIGKSLYCPEKVVQGAVLSALLLAEQELEGTL
jgi:halimadienyl-diphosphate synthase